MKSKLTPVLALPVLNAIAALFLTPLVRGQTPPPNDMFSNSIAITGAVVTVTGSNVGATTEPGEGQYIGGLHLGGKSVWWNWVAPSNGPVTVDTTGSSFDTVLGIYQGSTVATLKAVAGNDDGAPNFASGLTFTAAAGTNYHILVDGFRNLSDPNTIGAACGNIVLNLWAGPLPPLLASQPSSQMALPGSSVALTISAMGATPLYYQWAQNGSPIAGATRSNYTIAAAQPSDAGAYTVVVTNIAGTTTSAAAMLTVANIWITAQPQDTFVAAGYSANLNASATGAVAVTYQWQKNGLAIPGATGSSLTLSNASAADAGTYGVVGSGGADQASSSNATVTVISPYTFATLAGQPWPAGVTRYQADGVGTAARFYAASGIAVDASGTIYVSDYWGSTIRKITPQGVVTTIAGQPDVAGTNDGVGTAALFRQPEGITLDSQTNLYVADNFNHTIRKITPQGVVTTLAGRAGVSGFASGIGSAALFKQPSNLAVDNNGNVLVAEWGNYAIRKITPDGVVTTFCGGPGGKTALYGPVGIAVSASGTVYVADQTAGGQLPYDRLLTLSPSGVLLSWVPVTHIYGGCLDLQGNYYTAGFMGDNTIRRINPNGTITILAGLTGVAGATDGVGQQARFNAAWSGIAVDAAGNLVVGDYWNGVVSGGAPFALATLPMSQGVVSGTPVTLSVSALDSTAISCQWLFNGMPLPNETNSTLNLGPVTRATTGTYSVMVSDGAGHFIVSTDNVRALVPPILRPPQLSGTNAVTVLFQDSDGGLPFDLGRVTIQWRTNLPSGLDTNWQALSSPLLTNGGFAQFTDTNALPSGTRFYRVLEQ